MLIRLLAPCSSRPARIVYNSRNSAAQHETFGYKSSKTIVIPNGFDCELFHPNKVAAQSVREQWRIPKGRPLVGLIARYHPVKDHRTFLSACALVNREIPISILLAGRGVDASNGELTGMIHHLGLAGNVLLLGERFDLPRITASLDLAVLSSVAEGFPNVIGEAMSCGVPCVATNVGDAAFILNGAGKIVPTSDPGALALAMLDMLRLPHAQASELGARGRERIQTDFSLPAMARRFESLCLETTAKRQPRSRALRIPMARKD